MSLRAIPEMRARWLVRRLLSSRTGSFRGACHRDSTPTLLVVNYKNPRDTLRLIRSWRKFVSPNFPVVVVENSGLPLHFHYPHATRVVGLGFNLHHGLALDFGLAFVSSEYVVICDPDTIIANPDFWVALKTRIDSYGAASIAIGTQTYHPICLAFSCHLWKHNSISMEQDWSRDWDVAASLTHFLGGVQPGALIQRSRGAGTPVPTQHGGRHYIAEVYGEVFSNTFGASRILNGAYEFARHEGPLDEFRRLHVRWRRWADLLVADKASLEDFDNLVGIRLPADTSVPPLEGTTVTASRPVRDW
jgi:hypothetical protein